MIKEFLNIFRESSNSFHGQREDERVILLLRQHIFTLLMRFFVILIIVALPIAAGIAFWDYLSENNLSSLYFLVLALWLLFTWLMTFHSLTLYTLNTVIITNKRIIDSNQKGFFNRKISELYSHRIQDVSTHTNGFIETMLEFGDVVVQTAGSEHQFTFCDIPDPEKVKDTVMHIAGSQHSGVI